MQFFIISISYKGKRLIDCIKLSESFILTTALDSTEFECWIDTVEASNNGTRVQVQLETNPQSTSSGRLGLISQFTDFLSSV